MTIQKPAPSHAPVDTPTNRGPASLAWVRRMARWGYLAKGLIYLLIGYFAAMAALGRVRAPTDGRGVMRTIFNQPMGEFLLLFMAATLGCYCVWRLIQALGPPRLAGQRLGAGQRIHRLYSAGIHGLIAWGAVRMFVMRDPGPSSEQSWRETAAFVLSRPYGRWGVVAAGLVLVGAGLYKVNAARSARLWNDLRFREVPLRAQKAIVTFGRVGEATRGLMFALMGGFAVQAALRFDPKQVHGWAGTLQILEKSAFGPALLLAAAAGLFLFGLFLVLSSRYQRL